MGTPRQRLRPHGGARNRRDRTSTYLIERQCLALIAAADEALACGRPFNRFVTILWERGGMPRLDAATATGRFIKLASDWARRQGLRLCWAWVQEWGEIRGAHVHLLLHVPPGLALRFRPLPLRWVKTILPGDYRPGVIQVQRIRGAGNVDLMADLYRAALSDKLAYMLKAADPATGRHLGLPRHGEASLVFGKRAARWQRHRISR